MVGLCASYSWTLQQKPVSWHNYEAYGTHLASISVKVNQIVFTSKEQVASSFGVESTQSEANENHGGSHESSHNDAGKKEISNNCQI